MKNFNLIQIFGTIKALFGSFADEYVSKVDSFANKFTNWTSSNLGTSGAGMVEKIVGIAVGMIVVAVVIPPALTQIANAEIPESMTAVGTLLKTLLPILAIIGIVLYIYRQQ